MWGESPSSTLHHVLSSFSVPAVEGLYMTSLQLHSVKKEFGESQKPYEKWGIAVAQ